MAFSSYSSAAIKVVMRHTMMQLSSQHGCHSDEIDADNQSRDDITTKFQLHANYE